MKSKRTFISILLLSMTLFISACTPTNTPENPSKEPEDSNGKDTTKLELEIKEKDEKIMLLEKNIKDLEVQIEELEEAEANQNSQEQHLLINSVNVLTALKEENMEELKQYIHPEKGVRFSAYANVDVENDIVIERDEIVDRFNDSATSSWGDYDGRGDPIELSFKDYYKEFVYDQDFLNPHIIAINNTVSSGNTIDNIEEAYPDGEYIESYFEGFDQQYEGIDWKSLKLVFEKHEGIWYLVGIIHSQWTI